MKVKIDKSIIMQGMLWKFAERILAQGVSFLVSVVLSRLLLPDDYGVVALVLVFINIANVFVTSGFSTALIQKKGADETDFSTNFYCCFALSLVIYVVIFLCAPFIAGFYGMPDLTLIVRVFSIRIPISSISSIQHAYVEKNMLFKRFFLSTLLGTVLSGIVGILMALLHFGVWALIAQYFTNTIVDIVVLLITVPWRPRLIFSTKSAREMTNYGWKILASDLSGTMFDQLRSLLIGKVYLPSDLAYYNKGKQLPDLISVNVCASLMTVLFPAISNVNDDSDKVKLISEKALSILSYIMFPMFLGLASIAKPLVLCLYSEKWADAIIYIQVLAIAAMLSATSTVSLQAIKAVGRSDLILKMEFLKKPVYLVLLLIGIILGPIHIAVTMTIYNIFEWLLDSITLSSITHFTLCDQLKTILGPLGMSTIMALLIYPLSWIKATELVVLLLKVVCAIVSYIIMSIITKNESFSTILDILKIA